MILDIIEVDFDTVLPFWRDRLWPGRGSPIRPVSTMTFLGGYDLTIKQQKARFFAAYRNGGQMIGVFSGHPTSDTHYRARGLYVIPEYQQMDIGTNLVRQVVIAAAEANRDVCWCIPRVYNTDFFQKCGFSIASKPFTEGVEFGPNVYMARTVPVF